MNWLVYAFLSAIFAALTAILAKIGIKDINSNLVTAIRTLVVLVFAWTIVFFQHAQKEIPSISRFSLIFLVLSGISTGLSWLFYFRAIQIGEVSKVGPIDKLSVVLTVIFAVLFLKEKATLTVWLGAILMTVGTLLIGFGK